MADEKIVSKENGAKASKSDKSKKPGIFQRIGKYFRDTKGEFNKITWPTFPSVVRNTLVTLAVCAILGVLILVVDMGLAATVEWLASLKPQG